MSTFARFPPRLQEAIANRAGFTALRPVQELAGAAILDGDNAVVLAPTAGGKTEASIFPTLALLMEEAPEGVGALYIAPIKALLNNQAARLGKYTEMVGLSRFVWHGDTPATDKRKFIKAPAELLMTTPESLEVMLVSARVPAAKLFSSLRIVIVDEVHALAGTDRGAHFMSVLERLRVLSKHDVQRVGLSATVGNPDAILQWLSGTSERAGRVVDPPKNLPRRSVAVHLEPTVLEMATHAAQLATGKKSLFFCQSRAMTETVAERMRTRGTTVFVHHSSVSQEERALAEKNFESGQNACIACTSTLELGIDVGDLDNTTFFVEDVDTLLQAAALIELAKEGWVERVPVVDRALPVLVHQLLVATLQYGGIPRTDAWQSLARVPDFRGVRRDEFDHIVDHMVAERYLFEASGQLSMGETAERVYGRKNFMELYAVFSSPVLYRVFNAQMAELGSLEQEFVDNLVENMSSFQLGGRAWLVDHVNHAERTVRVKEAPRGREPSWGGHIPQMLGYELCQKMRHILENDTPLAYLDARATEALAARRQELGDTLRRGTFPVQVIDGKAFVWTFAGGRINGTLKYAFAQLGGFKVVADNFALKLAGDSVTPSAVLEVIERLSAPGFFQDQTFWEPVFENLPAYRLSKFQRALPPELASEMVAGYLLDLPGAERLVAAPKELLAGP